MVRDYETIERVLFKNLIRILAGISSCHSLYTYAQFVGVVDFKRLA
jgi:hypothetical protein